MARLRELHAKSRKRHGLDYLQAFDDSSNDVRLWFGEDDEGGAITALLPSHYRGAQVLGQRLNATFDGFYLVPALVRFAGRFDADAREYDLLAKRGSSSGSLADIQRSARTEEKNRLRELTALAQAG